MGTRTRKCILELSEEEVSVLRKAFEGIIKYDTITDPNDPHYRHSYKYLAGHHWVPMRLCQHHNPMFPVWHRAFLLAFEDALRTVPGCEQVTLPYYDPIPIARFPTSNPAYMGGLPDWLFTAPFASYELKDPALLAQLQYRSGQSFRAVTLPGGRTRPVGPSEVSKYKQLVNTKMFTQGIAQRVGRAVLHTPTWQDFVVFDAENIDTDAVESVHDTMHMTLAGHNGWLSSTNSAAFDPLFWFLHCGVDRWFALWQIRTGTNLPYVPGQGPSHPLIANRLTGNLVIDWDAPISPPSSANNGAAIPPHPLLQLKFGEVWWPAPTDPAIAYTEGSATAAVAALLNPPPTPPAPARNPDAPHLRGAAHGAAAAAHIAAASAEVGPTPFALPEDHALSSVAGVASIITALHAGRTKAATVHPKPLVAAVAARLGVLSAPHPFSTPTSASPPASTDSAGAGRGVIAELAVLGLVSHEGAAALRAFGGSIISGKVSTRMALEITAVEPPSHVGSFSAHVVLLDDDGRVKDTISKDIFRANRDECTQCRDNPKLTLHVSLPASIKKPFGFSIFFTAVDHETGEHHPIDVGRPQADFKNIVLQPWEHDFLDDDAWVSVLTMHAGGAKAKVKAFAEKMATHFATFQHAIASATARPSPARATGATS